MTGSEQAGDRTISLAGATGVGVGAIVGGGILVLAGVAFQATGPSAMVAFAANGAIALLTALSFAELSAAFPESGGAYTFAKKVLSVRVAFAVGWVLWFAYIVAGVLYALGFAEYLRAVIVELWRLSGGVPPAWLGSRQAALALAMGATAVYTLSLIRKAGGGDQWATVGKVIVFVFLIGAGAVALAGRPAGTVRAGLTPYFAFGPLGLLQAMGFTFIALQGFDLVAAVGGEVKAPQRNIPRAMFLSLGAALLIYLPLLFLVATAGVTGEASIVQMSQADPGTVMATAARNFLGAPGYWLVMLAAVLSMISALQANLLAASRVALSMARDRTLPRVLAGLHQSRRTPVMAIYASALTLAAILLIVPDVAAAGAAASLIFLISFTLTHWTGFLARRRGGSAEALTFRTPLFPAVPALGGAACCGLAIFQAVAVPAAGGITVIWLGLGVILYFALFAGRARAADAFAEARDPHLVQLRGRSPLVLVPIANPDSAPALVEVADALAPPAVGRVLLLTVMRPGPGEPAAAGADEPPESLLSAQHVQRHALAASLAAGSSPQALLTIAASPWHEIERLAEDLRCESLLVGLSQLDQLQEEGAALEQLLNEVKCDVTVLRTRPGWRLKQTRRVLVPTGGKSGQVVARARLLGSLSRVAELQVTFLQILPASASDEEQQDAEHALAVLAEDETPGAPEALVLRTDDVTRAVADQAAERDLVVLGLPRIHGRKLFGDVTLRIARETDCAMIMISRGS